MRCITNAPRNVHNTSTIAILKMRYECTPCPTFPKIFRYLQNMFLVIVLSLEFISWTKTEKRIVKTNDRIV
jgi:hypothetical protein